jgi:hypothetical protein
MTMASNAAAPKLRARRTNRPSAIWSRRTRIAAVARSTTNYVRITCNRGTSRSRITGWYMAWSRPSLGISEIQNRYSFRELWHSRSGFVYQRRHDLPSGDLLARGRLQTSSDTIDIDKFFPFQKLEECHAIAYNSSLRLRAHYGAYGRYSPERPCCIQLRCHC